MRGILGCNGAATGSVGGGGVGVGLGVGGGFGGGFGGGGGGGGGGGAASTTAVGSERSSADPSSLVSVSRTSSTWPTSSFVGTYVFEAAEEIFEHLPSVSAGQRSHAQVTVGGGSPVHDALALRGTPSCGVPVIVGPLVITGESSARVASAPSRIAPEAKTAAAAVQHTRRPSLR
jgi:hypothetical protein